MFVKPALGMSIPDPELGDLLPVEGREVPEWEYWWRRLAEGAVVNAKRPAAVSEPEMTAAEAAPSARE